MARESPYNPIRGCSRALGWALLAAAGVIGAWMAVRAVGEARTEVLLRSYVEEDDAGRERLVPILRRDGARMARAIRLGARRESTRAAVVDLVRRVPPAEVPEAVIAEALEMLGSRDEAKAGVGEAILLHVGQRAVRPLAARLRSGRSPRHDERAIAVLLEAGESGERAVAAYFIGLFRHADRGVRRLASSRLQEMGKAATPDLLEAFADPVAEVRLMAAHTLERIGDDRAILGLIEALERESDLGVKVAIGSALMRMTGKRARGHDLDAWRAYYERRRSSLPPQVLPSWAG